MYRVILADDEEKLCKLIAILIDWEKIGCELIRTVYSGDEALKAIQEEKPDIVITDIRMPGCSGLDLIKQAKKIDEDVEFLIISGYRYFEYAHNALKYGVEHYLLKPIEEEKLNEALCKIVDKLHKKEQMKENAVDVIQYNKNIEILNQELIRDLYYLKINPAEDSIERLNERYCCQFFEGLYFGIIVKIDIIKHFKSDLQTNVPIMIIKNVLADSFHYPYINFICDDYDNEVVGIINCIPADREMVISRLAYSLTQMNDSPYVFGTYDITIAIGKTVSNISNLQECFVTAKQALYYRLALGTNRIINFQDINFCEYDIQDVFSVAEQTEFRNALEILDAEAVNEFGKRINVKLRSDFSNNPIIFYELSYFILNICSEEFKRHAELQSVISESLEVTSKKILDYINPDEMINMVFKDIDRVIHLIMENKKMELKRPVKRAKQFMSKNYGMPLSLDDIAADAGVNPVYLSSIFKKDTGENISEYLMKIRIEAAKNFLKTTDIPVAQIANKVGYSDARHFSKTFSKMVGVKPTEYRRFYQ